VTPVGRGGNQGKDLNEQDADLTYLSLAEGQEREEERDGGVPCGGEGRVVSAFSTPRRLEHGRN